MAKKKINSEDVIFQMGVLYNKKIKGYDLHYDYLKNLDEVDKIAILKSIEELLELLETEFDVGGIDEDDDFGVGG